MQLHYDKETDAIYLRIDDQPIVESEEVRPGIVLDFDDQGNVVAIEVLRTKRGSAKHSVTTANDHSVPDSSTMLADDLRDLRDRLHASGIEPMTIEAFDRELAEMRGE